MKVAILGFGTEGRSAYEYWSKDSNEITVCDQNESLAPPEGVQTQLGASYLKGLDQFDVIVRSPGIHPRDIVAANNEAVLSKVTTITNEFFHACLSKNVIAITGTKGKGTTSTLITKMLEAAGKRVHLGGNIGLPVLELLKDNIQPDDWIVLELSSFQLIDLKTSPHIAVCLMVEPEHLDWHEDHNEYISAKQQLFMNQTAEDIAIYYAANENSEAIADASEGKQIPYMQKPGAEVIQKEIVIDGQLICAVDQLKLLGEHNWQNVCAAVTAVWQVSQDVNAIRSVLTSFSGLPFRIELRREVDGVRYYNDSFASGSDSCLAAVQSIPGPKVMIIGGYDRGLDLTGLAKGLKAYEQDLRKVVLIGQTAQKTAENLQAAGFTNFTVSKAKTMPEIVAAAQSLAQSSDAVVLSPGFASFDMFKNFEDRGIKFNEAVAAL